MKIANAANTPASFPNPLFVTEFSRIFIIDELIVEWLCRIIFFENCFNFCNCVVNADSRIDTQIDNVLCIGTEREYGSCNRQV